MHRTLPYALLLFALAAAAPAHAVSPRTVAVLPWTKGAAPADFDGFGTALAGMVTSDLATTPALQLVERERIGAILGELALSRSDFIDPNAALKVGRGIGAQLLLSGSYSVVAERLLLDARLVAVEGGDILAAVRSEGPLADYVAVEKDIVEQLLARLEVALAPAARRRLLMAAPTEDAHALARYGAGVEALDVGDVAAARRAFEAALAVDPEFAQASTALASLKARAEALSQAERARTTDARAQAIARALEALPDEATRPDGFAHTRATILDFAIRQTLLQREHQDCRRYEELTAFLLHTRGRFTAFWDLGDGAAPMDAWKRAERLVDERGRALGLVGPDTPYGTRPGDLMHDAANAMGSGPSLLLFRNLAPEKFHGSLAAALAACHPREARPAAWSPWIARVTAWGLAPESLWSVHGEGPATVTVRDAVELHQAFLEADADGVTPAVTARVDAVLARHPEGDRNRTEVLQRVREITGVATARERRVAARHGLAPAHLVAAAEAVATARTEAFRADDPVCAAVVADAAGGAERALTRYRELRPNTDARTLDSRLDALGEAIAVPHLAGCFAAPAPRPDLAALFATVRGALARRHPETLEDARCREDIAKVEALVSGEQAEVASRLTPREMARQLRSILSPLAALRTRRCLVP